MATKEITLKKYDLAKPIEAVNMATALKQYVVKQNLFTSIQGKNYAHVDGWQFAGFLAGMNAIIEETIDLSTDKEKKWKSVAKIYQDGVCIGRGDAICSSDEVKAGKKVRSDEYAILSMSQTRAIGKAYRNKIGWIMKLAGYQSTPSEEMHKVSETMNEPTIVPNEPISQNQGNQTLKKGQVLDPDGKPCYLCSKCDAPISEQEYGYSIKVYGKSLCREDQKIAKKK